MVASPYGAILLYCRRISLAFSSSFSSSFVTFIVQVKEVIERHGIGKATVVPAQVPIAKVQKATSLHTYIYRSIYLFAFYLPLYESLIYVYVSLSFLYFSTCYVFICLSSIYLSLCLSPMYLSPYLSSICLCLVSFIRVSISSLSLCNQSISLVYLSLLSRSKHLDVYV